MREIKFRAWSQESKKMMDWNFIMSVNNLTKLLTLNHVDVMQFTGFTDSKGFEIYEGDILGEWNLIDGEMEMSMLQVYWCEKTGAWMLDASFKQDKSTGNLLSEELIGGGYEVIGNIYEEAKDNEC